jgi:hypothetical protein
VESIVLDPLAYEIDRASLLAKVRLKEGSDHTEEFDSLIREAKGIAHPRAIYRMAFVTSRGDKHVVAEGLRFESRVLTVNLDNQHRFFAFCVTAGGELDAWAKSKTDLLEHYWADAINQSVCVSARAFLEKHIEEKHGLVKTARMSPGSLPDWPVQEQRVLFELLGDTTASIGVTLSESMLMMPIKSVSGIFFHNDEGFASCRLCPREGCPGRKAPYDPGLYERRFREAGESSTAC